MLYLTSPLSWPADEPRTPIKRTGNPFQVHDMRTTLRDLESSLAKFKATNINLSGASALRGKVDDPAVALFFELPGKRPIAICCDLYHDQVTNIRAILKICESMRTIERYGGQKMSQKSFTGFAALPAPVDVWTLLGLNKSVAQALSEKLRREYVMEGFRSKAREGHAAGADMSALSNARDEALRQLGVS